MKNLDLFSRRILVISLSISMVLLSSALFVFSLNSTGHAHAKENYPNNNYPGSATHYLHRADTIDELNAMIDEDIMAIQTFGLGIRDGNLYFGILYNNNTIGLHMAPAEGEDVIPW